MSNEQLPAIRSSRGILLDAGAGSGKTHVIIEHLFFKLENLLSIHTQGQSQEIKNFLRKTCILTFTENAINEIKARIGRTLEKKIELAPDKKVAGFYLQVKELIGTLTVSTIHGLCYRLLKQGISLDFGSDFEIRDEFYLRIKFERVLEDLLSSGALVNPLAFVHKKHLLEILVKIFADSRLRLNWKKYFAEDGEEHEGGDFYSKLMEINLIKRILDLPDKENLNGIKTENKFMPFIQELINIIDHHQHGQDFLERVYRHFQITERLPVLPKQLKEDEDWVKYWENVGRLKKFLKENAVTLFEFHGEKLKAKRELLHVVKMIYLALEKNYLLDRSITYGDLEYYVHSILETQETPANGRFRFDYMIVDEFQDVSQLQYMLFYALCGKDVSRIFAVGDVKQSIYRFRGGEILVFQDFEKLSGHRKVLSNNYRSHPLVVDFNNRLFSFLLKKVKEEDFNAIFPEFIPQTSPQEGRYGPEDAGTIEKILLSPEDEWSHLGGENKHVEKAEAKAIALRLEQLFHQSATDEVHSCAVLYKKIRPSYLLMQELKRRDISFHAQMKVNFGEDFFFDLFFRLYEICLEINKSLEERINKALIFFSSFLEWRQEGSLKDEDLRLALDKFFVHCEFIGPYEAYLYFYQTLQIYYQEARMFFDLLSSLQHSAQDLEDLYRMLKMKREDQYTFFYDYRGRWSRERPVQLMTVHMSKGLEFDMVFLAGMYTNDTYRANFGTNILGKTPGAVKIKVNKHDKKFIKSPEYLLEEIFEKNHEMAESLRLFYVACTRPKPT